jgi:hypothetical protein
MDILTLITVVLGTFICNAFFRLLQIEIYNHGNPLYLRIDHWFLYRKEPSNSSYWATYKF